MSEVFSWPIRIYYEDTDLTGVVYHANYLRYFERARSEWLRAKGFTHERLSKDFNAAFTVVELNIRYRQPARLDDALMATVEIAERGRASMVFAQELRRMDAAQTLLASGTVKAACVDAVRFKPVAWPPGWLDP